MNKETIAKSLYENLAKAKNERQKANNSIELLLAKKSLRKFQIERLKVTHKDLLNNPDTKNATLFFLNELYGEKDLSKRDKDLEKLIPIMEKVFPANLLAVIEKAIVLDALTEELDNKMASALAQSFTEDEYFKVYREVTSKEERSNQINLVESLGYSLCDFINLPFISSTLKIMKVPALMANLGDMHKFLESGFNTFKNTKMPKVFINNMVKKEREILEETYK